LAVLKADYNYSLVKSKITYSFTNPITKIFIEGKMNVVIKQDTIFRIKDKKDTTVMVKIGLPHKYITKSRKNSLLGKWKWKYPTGDTAITEFTKDKMLFRMVNDRKKGTYSISNDR
jgi:hypothetical protein